MNFDKFKNVVPKKAQIDSKDSEYLQHLNSLKEPKQSNIWAMVGTVAAAFTIVSIVALWALIGRGIRGTAPTVPPPATEGVQIDTESYKEYELTGELLYKIENAVLKPYKFTYIPLFNDKDPLSELKILEYYHILKPTAEINDFAKDLFNFEGKLHFDPEEMLALIIYEPNYKIQSIGECMLSNGQKMITISYFMEGYDYTLAYIESTDFAVDWFFMHQKNGALAEGEVTVESEFQSIAKEYCFEQMYDFERGTIPNYTESKIYIARFAQTTLYENKNNKQIYAYPLEFYKSKMTEIFGGYEIPDEITPIDELTGPKYWMFGPIRANDGTLIVALDNESGMSYYFDFNSYAEGEYNGKKTITVTYTATDPYSKSTKKYAVTYTTTDGIHPDKIIEKLEVSDTQIHYPNNKTEVVLTDITEWYEKTGEQNLKNSLSENKHTPPLNEVAQTKEYEFLGKKYNLNLKDSWYQQNSFALYRYTDGNGIGFVFTQNGELVEYEYSAKPNKKGTVTGNVTKDKATQIAKDFAKQMFGEQFDDYTFDEVTEIGPSGPTEEYIISFSKKYGADDYLRGEGCYVEVSINGDVLKCGIRSLYEFKKIDLDIYENISRSDIEKVILSPNADSGGSTYTIDSASISIYSNRTIIQVGILLKSEDGAMAGLERCLEASEK